MRHTFSVTHLQVGACRITVVPSVHDAFPFADTVNLLCRTEAFDAIAVELDADTLSAAQRFIHGLRPDADTGKICLPLMMGVKKTNRMILPSMKQRVVALRKHFKKGLSDLPEEWLFDEIGYRKTLVAALTPTDSIIEAIRCAVELETPIFGVDLKEFAIPAVENAYIGDPYLVAHESDTRGYLRFLPGADEQYVHGRREFAMAARLKALATEYRRVLFVCGAGHLPEIARRLSDHPIAPTSIESFQPREVSPLCVLPKITAAAHISLFPLTAALYEAHRKPANSADHSEGGLSIDEVRQHIAAAFSLHRKQYFEDRKDATVSPKTISSDAIRYQGFLNVARLFHTNLGYGIYRMNVLLQCAKSLMSREYVGSLSHFLMNIPWISEKDYPEVQRLTDSEKSSVTKSYIPRHLRGNANVLPDSASPETGFLMTWRPWETLLLAKCQEAFQKSEHPNWIRMAIPFGGDLHDGVHFKQTIRAAAKGEDSIYVSKPTKTKHSDRTDDFDGYPFVWIFEETQHAAAQWRYLFHDAKWLRPHAAKPTVFETMVLNRGEIILSTIGPCRDVAAAHPAMRYMKYSGLVQFDPICWTSAQIAHWLESNDAKRNPMMRQNADFEKCIDSACLAVGGIRKNMDWRDVLVATAISAAVRNITVVRKNTYRIAACLRKAAKAGGISLLELDLGLFEKETLDKLSTCITAPAAVHEPWAKFEPWVEEVLGQKQHDLDDLIPLAWKNYGRY